MMIKKLPPTFGRPAVDRTETNVYMAKKMEETITEKSPPTHTPSIEGGGRVGNFDGESENKKNEPGSAKEQILAMFAKLSATEQRQLLAELALSVQQPRQTRDSRDLDMWTEGVHSSLLRVTGPSGGALAGQLVLRRMLSVSANWEPVRAFMENSGLQNLGVAQRLSIYMMLGGLLVQHAQKTASFAGVPLSMRFVSNCAPRIASIFDAAFPGYLRAGLAPMVAAQLTQVRSTGD